MAVTTAKGLKNEFVKDYSAGSSEHLANVKIDQLIVALNALLTKLDADTGVVGTNYHALIAIAKTMTDQLIKNPPKMDL